MKDLCKHIDYLLQAYKTNKINLDKACEGLGKEFEDECNRKERKSKCSAEPLEKIKKTIESKSTPQKNNARNNKVNNNSNNDENCECDNSKLLREAILAQNAMSYKENESLLHNFYDKLNYRKPGYSYIHPKYWSVPQKRPPVCFTDNKFNPASLYDRGTPTNVLELTKDGDIAATEDNVSLTNVGSILPKFQYKEMI